MTPQELKAYIEKLDPKTSKALIEALTAEYNKLAGITVVEVAQTEQATAPAAKAAVAATADEAVTTSEPNQPKATADAKAAAETGATAADQKPEVAIASAGDTEATGATPREVAQASTTYELSESVKQIIKEFEATGDDGGYPPSAYYPVTEAVLKRYCRDNDIDYDELMKNNRVVKTQSFLTQTS